MDAKARSRIVFILFWVTLTLGKGHRFRRATASNLTGLKCTYPSAGGVTWTVVHYRAFARVPLHLLLRKSLCETQVFIRKKNRFTPRNRDNDRTFDRGPWRASEWNSVGPFAIRCSLIVLPIASANRATAVIFIVRIKSLHGVGSDGIARTINNSRP